MKMERVWIVRGQGIELTYRPSFPESPITFREYDDAVKHECENLVHLIEKCKREAEIINRCADGYRKRLAELRDDPKTRRGSDPNRFRLWK